MIDVDLHECMMLKAVQTTLEKGEEKKEMSLYDWYAKVLEDDKVALQCISKVLVADSAFSKRPFIDKVMEMGFHVVSRLRHDAALFYIWDGHRVHVISLHLCHDAILSTNIQKDKVIS